MYHYYYYYCVTAIRRWSECDACILAGELGWIIRKYDLKNNGKVVCRNFLNDFLKLGNEGRYAQHLEQLKR